MLFEEDIKEFTLTIKDGAFYWQVTLKDNYTYQIKYTIEEHYTPAGNKSKRKIYFIYRNNEKLIFTDEVKKRFYAFRRPYLISGI